MFGSSFQVCLGGSPSAIVGALANGHSRRKESGMNDRNQFSRAVRRIGTLALFGAVFTTPMASAAIRVDVSVRAYPRNTPDA